MATQPPMLYGSKYFQLRNMHKRLSNGEARMLLEVESTNKLKDRIIDECSIEKLKVLKVALTKGKNEEGSI